MLSGEEESLSVFAALVAVHLPDLWGGAARRLQPSSRRVAVCSGDMHPWTTWTGCCREMAGQGCSGEGAAGTLLWWWHLALGLPFPAAGVLAAPALAGAPTLKSIPLQYDHSRKDLLLLLGGVSGGWRACPH